MTDFLDTFDLTDVGDAAEVEAHLVGCGFVVSQAMWPTVNMPHVKLAVDPGFLVPETDRLRRVVQLAGLLRCWHVSAAYDPSTRQAVMLVQRWS